MKISSIAFAGVVLVCATTAWAGDARAPLSPRAWAHVTFGDTTNPDAVAVSSLRLDPAASADTDAAQRPTAFTYSESYHTRAKIHKYASFATLPLFISQLVVGQKLYDGTGTDSTRSLHSGLTVGIASLFAVNSVTGVWNLMEGRKDPKSGTRRWVHGLLMLAADAGFVATGAMAPDSEGGEGGQRGQRGGEGGGSNKSAHRTVAITSMGLATVSYLIMLFPH